MKRRRIREAHVSGTSEQHVPDTLLSLAANSMTGPAGHYARLYAETKDHHFMTMVTMYHNLQAKANVKGRVPRARSYCSWWQCSENKREPKHHPFCISQRQAIQREEMHGKELELARATGNMIGTAVISGSSHSGGVVLRVDSMVFPELWMEITLSPQQVKEAYALIQ